jgi:hypothetical protein
MKSISEDLKRHITSIAAKLLNEGLTPSGYTKAKAKDKVKDVVAPVFVRKMIDSFSPEIKKEMTNLKKKS